MAALGFAQHPAGPDPPVRQGPALPPVPCPRTLGHWLRSHGGAGTSSVLWNLGPEESFSPNFSFQMRTRRQGEGFAQAQYFRRRGVGLQAYGRLTRW